MSDISLIDLNAPIEQTLVASTSEPWAIQQEIEEKLPSFQNGSHFIEFDLRLTPEEIDSIEQFRILKSSNFANDGHLEKLATEADGYVKTLAPINEAISETIAKIIKRVAEQLNFAFGSDSISTTIRATEEDQVRYEKLVNRGNPVHTGFHADEDDQGRFYAAFTLKGPSTFFYTGDYENLKPDFDSHKQIFPEETSHQRDPEKTALNSYRAHLLPLSFNDPSLIHQPTFGKGAIWLTGFQNGTIHAAPTSNLQERFFVIMAPVEENQIAEYSFNSFIDKYDKYKFDRQYAESTPDNN